MGIVFAISFLHCTTTNQIRFWHALISILPHLERLFTPYYCFFSRVWQATLKCPTCIVIWCKNAEWLRGVVIDRQTYHQIKYFLNPRSKTFEKCSGRIEVYSCNQIYLQYIWIVQIALVCWQSMETRNGLVACHNIRPVCHLYIDAWGVLSGFSFNVLSLIRYAEFRGSWQAVFRSDKIMKKQ